jgi:GT2 family glycosyltransferase
MPRLVLTKSKLINFPFRLLPHFQFTSDELERTLAWESEFEKSLSLPTIELCDVSLSELSLESINVQSSLLNSNAEYVLVIDGQTVLHPSALFIIKKQCFETKPDIIFWDESEYNPTSLVLSRYARKGRFSRLSAIGRNLLGTSAVVKKSLWETVSQEKSLLQTKLWKLSLITTNILHIPLSLSSLPQIIDEGENIEELSGIIFKKFTELKIESSKLESGDFGRRNIIKLVANPTPVGMVIPFKNEAAITIRCIESISKQQNSNLFHLRLVNNGSLPAEREKVLTSLKDYSFASAKILDDSNYFNYARLNNFGLKDLLETNSEEFVLMNNDVELESPDAISQLQAWSKIPELGLVGGTLRYPGGSIQSAGINFSQVRPANVSSENLHADKLREVDGLCFAFVMIKKTALEALGGLDEFHCPNGYGDTLFCQIARQKGFKSLHVPWINAIHHESVSRGVRPEELELLELVQSGMKISDLWSDLEAERQPMIIPLGPTSTAFQTVVRQVSKSRKLLITAEAVCKPIVKVGKALRKQISI